MLKVNSSYKICGIYSIYNKETDFSYIGSSRVMHERLSQHIWKLRCGRHTNEWLQNSFNKHGEEAFEIIVLEVCTEENLKIREEFHILNTEKRYNIIDKPVGPLHLPTPTEERRQKVSKANKGRKITEEQRKRFSDSHKGLKRSEESKQKTSKALKAFYSVEENKHYPTKETLQKSRETFLKNHPDGHRKEWTIKICLFCKNTFTLQPSLVEKRKYCSNRCRWATMKGKTLTMEHRAALSGAGKAFYSTEKGKQMAQKIGQISSRIRVPREIRTCACGCGETFEIKLTDIKNYVVGHYFRNRIPSPEVIEKRRQGVLKFYSTPEGQLQREKLKISGLQGRLKQLNSKKVVSSAN